LSAAILDFVRSFIFQNYIEKKDNGKQ